MTPCIEHNLVGTRDGYGPHRRAFKAHYGYLPKVVRHTCDNPRCINPEHLVPGGQRENMQDMVSRGRCPLAKMDDATVRYLRQMYKPRCKVWGAGAIAKRMGLTLNTVHDAVTGKTWRHVA